MSTMGYKGLEIYTIRSTIEEKEQDEEEDDEEEEEEWCIYHKHTKFL
jgi:hypothetical protein